MARRKLVCPPELFEPGQPICDGNGSFRRVYVCKNDETKVVKIVRDPAYAKYNRREYAMYMRAKPERRDCMAAVFGISDNGDRLVMERTKLLSYEKYTKAIEDRRMQRQRFKDAHHGNVGELPDGRVVMHDYAGP